MNKKHDAIMSYTSGRFDNEMRRIRKDSGLYFLYDEDKNLIYIGKSKQLGNRIITSAVTRKAYYYEYLIESNQSDVSIYEAYYISLLKPPLNVEGKHSDKPTITFPCIRNDDIKAIFDNVYTETTYFRQKK